MDEQNNNGQNQVKFCPNCGQVNEINSAICGKCKFNFLTGQKHKKNKIALWIFLGIIALIIIANLFGGDDGAVTTTTTTEPASVSAPETSTEDPSGELISLDEFNQLENGMDKETVEGIIGSSGTTQAESGSGNLKMEVVGWDGSGGLGANASITFMNGKLESKAQFGLE